MKDGQLLWAFHDSLIKSYRKVWEYVYIDILPNFYRWWKIVYIQLINLKGIYLESEVEWAKKRVDVDLDFLNKYFWSYEYLSWIFKDKKLTIQTLQSEVKFLTQYFHTNTPLLMIEINFEVEDVVILDHDMSISDPDIMLNKYKLYYKI